MGPQCSHVKRLLPADTLQKIGAYETAKKTLVALRQSTAPYAVPHTVRWGWNVRFWHKADITFGAQNVRFRRKSGHRDRRRADVVNRYERPDVTRVTYKFSQFR